MDAWFVFVRGQRLRLVDAAAELLDRAHPGWDAGDLSERRSVPEAVVDAVAGLLDPRKWQRPRAVARRVVVRSWSLRRQQLEAPSPEAAMPPPRAAPAPPLPPPPPDRSYVSQFEQVVAMMRENDDKVFRSIHGRSRREGEERPELSRMEDELRRMQAGGVAGNELKA